MRQEMNFLTLLDVRAYTKGKERILPMGNDRNAGRKRKFNPEQIHEILEVYKTAFGK